MARRRLRTNVRSGLRRRGQSGVDRNLWPAPSTTMTAAKSVVEDAMRAVTSFMPGTSVLHAGADAVHRDAVVTSDARRREMSDLTEEPPTGGTRCSMSTLRVIGRRLRHLSRWDAHNSATGASEQCYSQVRVRIWVAPCPRSVTCLFGLKLRSCRPIRGAQFCRRPVTDRDHEAARPADGAGVRRHRCSVRALPMLLSAPTIRNGKVRPRAAG